MKKKFLSLLAVAFAGLFLLASCGKSYLVSFEEDGGSEVADVEVKEGELVTLPANPTKEGLTFDGWYTDPNCTKAFDATQPVVEELVLYAKWSVKLTFDSKGGSAVDAIVAKGASVYELPANPTRAGYAFVGWYTDEAYTTSLPALVFPVKNTTAYAKWLALDSTTKYTFTGFASNDANAFDVEDNKFTATEAKGEYTMINTAFNISLAGYNTVVMDVVGTEGVEILLKFEDDNNAAVGIKESEAKFVLTGKEQQIIWSFADDVLANSGIMAGKFGFFLAPGKLGTVEEQPNEEVVGAYVEIKAAYATRALAEGEQNKQVAVTYVVNGDKPVSAQFVTIGEKAIKPADPEKDGYVFEGWFKDAACTQAYDWNTELEESITLYAKWEEDAVKFVVVDAIEDEYKSGDEGVYTSTYADGKLTISRTAVGDDKKWSCVNGKIMGKEIIGMKYLYLTLTGTKDQKLLIKINNQFERWVDLTGQEQSIVVDMSKVKVNADVPALYFFVNGDRKEACTVEFKDIVFSSYRFDVSALEDEYKSGDEGVYTSTYADGKLTISRTAVGDDKKWANVSGKIKGEDVSGAKYIYLTLKGTKDQRLLIKFNNQFERWVDLTGDVQTVRMDISRVKVNASEAALYFFVNGDRKEACTVEFTNILFTSHMPKVDALEDEYKSGDEGVYTSTYADGKLTISRTAVGDDKKWANVSGKIKGEDIIGSRYLYITLKGTKDQRLLIKFNNQFERWVDLTGDVQTVRMDISKVKVNASEAALYFFLNGDRKEACTVEFTEIKFASYSEPVNLLAKDLVGSEETHVTITKEEKYIEIGKDAEADAWANVKTTVKGEDIVGASVLMLMLEGTKDAKLLVKFNNQHETWVDLTGEPQLVAINISKVKVNGAEPALYLFINGDQKKAGSVKLYQVAVGDMLAE